MKLKHYDYQADLQIDPEALDIEWMEQSQLFMKYADASAQARHDVDIAKEQLELAKSEADLDVRNNPEAYTGSDKKPTESFITAIVTADATVREKQKALHAAKHTADILSLAVKAFEQRKSALENLVKLFGQSYFSGPIEPRNLGLEFNKKASQSTVRSRVHDKMNKDNTAVDISNN